MTPEQIASAIGCPLDRAKIWASPLTLAMDAYGITSTVRAAAFLAQIGHESGRLRYVRELWGPTPAQLRYEGRLDLGNTQKGDGFKYRGRGLIQITGRKNYRSAGKALGLPLEERPEMAELPTVAARSAAWFWSEHGCNELADVGDFNKITRIINGGLNGEADRLALWETAKGALA